ncbi:MAG TPA: hypothetical protein VHM26_10295, partial [Chitinophagaceae bacterium]|nr:hypothetical protein [Chitinophagaceae bacterium]
MKKLILSFLLFAGYNVVAQNVGIGITVPHNTAALEIRSTSKGFLMPRLTAAARQAMFGTPAGMMVYDTDAAAFMYHDGNKWRPISDANPDSTLVDYDTGTPEVTANMTAFTTTTAKSGILYDNGGPAGNHTNNAFNEYFVYLGAGPLATNDSTLMYKIVVEEMNLESPHDTLLIYVDSDHPVKFTGTTVRTFYLPAIGALRFNFQSNASVTQAGFKIRWSQVMARNTEASPRFGWYYDVMARAVRGGMRASDNAWDTEDLGLYSFGWGYDAQASGFNSFAAGWNATASKDHAVAMGEGNKATGTNSVALGLNCTASGFYGFAVGQQARAEGEGSFATGLSNEADGMQSFVAGQASRASGRAAVAMGTGVVARGYTTVFGRYNDTLTGTSNSG